MKTIAVGTRVPDFELPDQHGIPTRLSDQLAKGPVVLFFYPMAMTSGCTRQACRFRDLAGEFTEAGAQRLGISVDAVARQRQFAEGNAFDYPLLSDESGEVATSFGVRRRFVTPVKRATFVIDQDLTVVEVITSEMDMEVHADRALEAVRSL